MTRTCSIQCPACVAAEIHCPLKITFTALRRYLVRYRRLLYLFLIIFIYCTASFYCYLLCRVCVDWCWSDLRNNMNEWVLENAGFVMSPACFSLCRADMWQYVSFLSISLLFFSVVCVFFTSRPRNELWDVALLCWEQTAATGRRCSSAGGCGSSGCSAYIYLTNSLKASV